MTATSTEYADFIIDQLAPIGVIQRVRFFGGIGLTAGGVQFAMLMKNTLYFCVNDATRPSYEALGSRCFSYATKKGRVEVKRYYQVPDAIVEQRDEIVAWARKALVSAAVKK
ncbi:MAG: TfoX/Sxy family protein [Rhodoferax sp.]